MGLYAYVYSLLMLIDVLKSIGAEQVYIARSPSDPVVEKAWLAGCWNTRLVLATFVGLLMFLGGLVVSNIRGEERLGILMMMMSLLSPLMALRSAVLIHQLKVQHFAPLSKFEMAAALLQSLLPLVVVYFYRSVEWLVLANLLAALLTTALSHVFFPMRLSFRLPSDLRKELLFYGKNNIAVSLLTTVHTNLDNIAVGSFVGRAALGIYSTGYRLAMTPHDLIQPIAQRILIPNYREAYDRGLAELAGHWRASFRFLAIGYTALSGILILLADWGVALLFGSAWVGLGYVLVFASFIVFFRGMAVAISPLMVILRAPHIDTRFKVVEVAAFALFVVAGAALGSLEAFLVGGIASYFLAFWLRWVWWRRQLGVAKLTEFTSRELLFPLSGTAILLGAVLLRMTDLYPLLSAFLLCALLVVPAFWLGRGLVNQFEEKAV